MVIDSAAYREQGFRQSQKNETLLAVRGNIYDRHDRPLTRNIIHYSLGAHPSKIKNKQSFSELIAEATGREAENYIGKLESKSDFVYLDRNLRRDKVESILGTRIAGLVIERKSRRSYPHSNVAAQIVGFTDVDDEGLVGIEKEFNTLLSGTPGWVVKQVNGEGRSQIKTSFPMMPPVDGANIQLTIDLEYQSILQEELARRVNESNAKGAMGVLMDPQTGAILAMASLPDYDPNRPGASPTENQKNKAITDQFEPGSTYKIVAATAAVATQTVSLFDEFYCEDGQFTVAGKTITDHEKFGLLTFPQIIAHSSNVGTIKIAQELGRNPLYQYSRDFGFGTLTGIRFPGETQGTLRQTKDWSEISLAEVSIGYEVGVTALQMVSAYAAIANGGFLLKPRLVEQILGQNGNVVYAEKPEVIRKVADPEIMATVKDMLVEVVKTGTGSKARIQGWSVAGKTGTAHKFMDGSYSDKYISNFAGFFPAENPQVVGIIILDEPKYGLHWGGYGAAPVFRRVAQRIINMDDSIQYHKPKTKRFNTMIADNQNVAVPTSIPALNTVSPYPAYQDGYTIVPDVRGMSIRKAKQILIAANLRADFTGSGHVVWQSPKPGTKKLPGSICTMGLN
ncbi:MAG: penicillin-binding protein [Candidatus Marinimicrobia bacterium]|jgi:cell division protein FtsI/penicillin-binding protein 2|nr:penicillin-binding protein [Candidatus Neomarinimicrobiota bacterium]MDD9930424.1 penicillin-binding protein [Candidatus Neomarinimicrobiota bacterium]MDP6991468.1 penicillin-binding protein [Candidatus Neomarinimicrobiota bacterium]